MSHITEYESLAQITTRELSHAVLGACLNGRSPSCVPFLRPEHFPTLRDSLVWGALLDLDAQGIVGEMTPLLERLHRSATTEDINWQAYLFEINSEPCGSSLLSLEENARTMYDNYRRYRICLDAHCRIQAALDRSRPLPPDDATRTEAEKEMGVGDILKAVIPPLSGPWKGVIPVGLTVLGARPKYGKSILMLQVSSALGSGGMLFGQPVPKTPVLYFALEDSVRRLQERLKRLGTPADADIKFVRRMPPLYNGGIAEVEAAARDYGMIVIDTLARAMPAKDIIRESSLYGDMLGRLQSAALENNMSVVAVLHRRKRQASLEEGDPVDDVLGTTHMTAAADSVLCIYRDADKKRAGGRAEMKGRSRDMEDVELTMEFDPQTVCWQLVGHSAEVVTTEAEEEILEVLQNLGKSRAATVAQAIGAQRSNTSKRLQDLWKKGIVRMELLDNISYYFLKAEEGLNVKSE